MTRNFIIILATILCLASDAKGQEVLDLSGEWKYFLHEAPLSIPGEGIIDLPDTPDNARKSVYNPPDSNLSHLRREFSFIGTAVYSKDITIPQDWSDKSISLFIERTRPSVLLIDGDTIGSNSRISSPQNYDLTDVLSPGTHKLEIIVNNSDSIPTLIATGSNATSENTQTNWNGILGEISLTARNKFHIRDVKILDSFTPDSISLNVLFSCEAPEDLKLLLKKNGSVYGEYQLKENISELNIPFPVAADQLWSANNPQLHNLEFIIVDSQGQETDRSSILTGFRQFTAEGKGFQINSRPVFLRGTVNAAVFPLTAYAPTDEESWTEYFSILKDYGFNHVRFHSWTPPEAAFKAADKTGMYIMAELPLWGELDKDSSFRNRFLTEELQGIMEAYGHHPSFVMFSPGNELFGDTSVMKEFMEEARRLNPRILSTYGTNIYLGIHGEMGDEDFIVSSKTDDDERFYTRGSSAFTDLADGGIFNSGYPGNDFNFSFATQNLHRPLISHEVGQYQSYPDFSQIELFTGILKPDNLISYRSKAHANGLLPKNKKFAEASSAWTQKLYKAEIEAALRTPGISGFQLFGFQDYPGQGGAYVGIADVFMRPKSNNDTSGFKNVNNDLSIIAEFPKFSFPDGEQVKLPLKSVNFTDNPDTLKSINYSTGFVSGVVEIPAGQSVRDAGFIHINMPEIKEPQADTLRFSDQQGRLMNEYSYWIYPQNLPEIKNVVLTRNTDEALELTGKGKNVILYPDSAEVSSNTVGGLFVTDFWNFGLYRDLSKELNRQVSPGTLGLAVDAKHPALKKFPTGTHTDWQWFPIVSNSYPLIIDRLPKGYEPIIEVIDNVDRAFPLGLLMEFKIGKGKLLLILSDLDKAQEYPEGKWFVQSLKEYAAGKDFKPELTLTAKQLKNLLITPSLNTRLYNLRHK